MESAVISGRDQCGQAAWLKDTRAILKLYHNFHEDLLIYAYFMVQDTESSVKVVQALFHWLWENRKNRSIADIEYKVLLVEIRHLCLDQKTD